MTKVPSLKKIKEQTSKVYSRRYFFLFHAGSYLHKLMIKNGIKFNIKYLDLFEKQTVEEGDALALRKMCANDAGFTSYLVLNKLIANRIYTNETKSLAASILEKNNEATALFRAYDYFIQTCGYKNEYSELFLQKILKPRVFNSLNKKTKSRLVAICEQNGKHEKAVELCKEIGRKYIKKRCMYLSIADVCKEAFKYKSAEIESASNLYAEVNKNRQEFIDYISSSDTRVCIVGNGATELGKGLGDEIDGYDVVIRINNYSTKNSTDYGSKESVWVRVPNREVTHPHHKNNKFTIIAANNFVHKRADALNILASPYFSGSKVTVVPNEIFVELIDKLGSLPSTGLLVAYWVYKIKGKLKMDSLYGFSHFNNDTDFIGHYFKDEVSRVNHVHSWAKEQQLINKMVKK